MCDAGQLPVPPKQAPPCNAFYSLIVKGVNDGRRIRRGEEAFHIGTVLRRIFRQHIPEGIGCRIGQFPERRIMGETEYHIMAPFAQPLGLVDCLACTAAAVAGRGNDDYAHDVLSFGALCVKTRLLR